MGIRKFTFYTVRLFVLVFSSITISILAYLWNIIFLARNSKLLFSRIAVIMFSAVTVTIRSESIKLLSYPLLSRFAVEGPGVFAHFLSKAHSVLGESPHIENNLK